jgi:hypothetical protein
VSINRDPAVSKVLAEAVLSASQQQSVILDLAFCTGGIYEKLGRNIAAGVQAGISREYRERLIVDAEYTVGGSKV